MTEYVADERMPSVTELNALRREAGWHDVAEERVQKALSNTIYAICVNYGEEIIGCGRIVGDGGMYFYIHDVLVKQQHRQKGVGSIIMSHLMKFFDSEASKGCGAFIGLMIAPGLEKFYAKYGFVTLPEDSPGMCIWRNGH